jgi:predicted porin
MKNKLLLTTALIGSMSLAGVAQSEIKVSGSMEQTFASTSNKTTSASTNGLESGRALGNETNINFKGGQKLSNGMSVDMNFNIEFDTANAAKREGSMKIGTDDAYLIIANDFTLELNSISAPKVGDHPSTIASRAGLTAFTDGYIENNADDHVALGFKVAGGNLVAIYAPNSQLGGNEDVAMNTYSTGSGYSVTYLGSPVEGLTVGLSTSEKKPTNNTSTVKDSEAQKIMASYKIGKANIGVEYSDRDNNTTSDVVSNATSGALGSVESMFYGATYNVSDNLSAGLAYVITEDKDRANTNPDEEIKLITLGYNWNGLGLELSYAEIEDQNNFRGNDSEVFQARTVVRF